MGDEILTGFTSHAGGVLTAEGGVMRGELILTTRTFSSAAHGDDPAGVHVEALVSRIGSGDLRAVAGSPVPLASPGRTHEELHWLIVETLDTPVGGWENEPPASLRG